MKLYIWKNGRTTSDFIDEVAHEENMAADHSACFVVLAESKEQAVEMQTKDKIIVIGEPIEVDVTKSGCVVYADGDC